MVLFHMNILENFYSATSLLHVITPALTASLCASLWEPLGSPPCPHPTQLTSDSSTSVNASVEDVNIGKCACWKSTHDKAKIPAAYLR